MHNDSEAEARHAPADGAAAFYTADSMEDDLMQIGNLSAAIRVIAKGQEAPVDEALRGLANALRCALESAKKKQESLFYLTWAFAHPQTDMAEGAGQMKSEPRIGSFPADIQPAIFHFWQFAKFHGKKKCRKHGVGAFREFLRPQNVIPMYGPDREHQPAKAAEIWRAALADVCAAHFDKHSLLSWIREDEA